MSERDDAIAFPGVLGHRAVQGRLARALQRDQLHHALIFAGPEGVGKATLARGLAAALHCTDRPGQGCGECGACRRVTAGTHTGLEWVRPAEDSTTIKVEAARELAARLQHAPFESNAHLVVFDPADALNDQAYNALLKTIEEPNPGVRFVMITTNLHRLLPTILSRCMTIRMGRLDDDEVATILDRTLAEAPTDPDGEPVTVTPERRALALRLADGSAGRALAWAADAGLDAGLEFLRATLAARRDGAAAIFSGNDGPLWRAFADASAGPATGRPARERAAARQLGALWLLHLRERLRGRPGLPGMPADSLPHTTVLHDLDLVQTFYSRLERNPNVRLALEHLLLEASA